MTREEIFVRLRDLLARSFNIEPARITAEARLMEDLDLDSIDAIDMVVQLQEWTGRHVPEEALRSIRTVDEVVSMVEHHLAEAEKPKASIREAASSAGSDTSTESNNDAGTGTGGSTAGTS